MKGAATVPAPSVAEAMKALRVVTDDNLRADLPVGAMFCVITGPPKKTGIGPLMTLLRKLLPKNRQSGRRNSDRQLAKYIGRRRIIYVNPLLPNRPTTRP